MMDFTFTSQLHYLVHQVDGEYVAHCLDLDLVGSGRTIESAVDQLNELVRAVVFFCIQANVPDTSAHCSRAPKEYWDMFKEAYDEHDPVIKTLDISPEVGPVTVMQCHFTYCLAIVA